MAASAGTWRAFGRRAFRGTGWAHTSIRSASSSQDTYEVVIGLEIHVQVKANTKLFSGAGTSFGTYPNSQVALFDASLPGTLPVINRACVEAAVRTGFALGADVQLRSNFDRKHYNYADLPHGYQITQKHHPIVLGGKVEVPLKAGGVREVRLERIQLEVDTGKSSREGEYTAVDLNRAGSALMEIVSEPDMRSGEEAVGFVKALQQMLRHIGTSDGNMEEGSLRADVNVSLRSSGGRQSTRCELKNLNSLRSIQRAVEFETARHRAALEAGGDVERETRTFDVSSGETVPLRSKESLLDYRFLVEPDLPPLVLSQSELYVWKRALSETPAETLSRMQEQYGVSEEQAQVLMSNLGALPLFEGVLAAAHEAAAGGRAVMAGGALANWLTGEVVGAAKRAGAELSLHSPSAGPGRLVDLLALVGDKSISSRQAKPVLAALLGGDLRPVKDIADELGGGGQLSDEGAIMKEVVDILRAFPGPVQQYREGRDRLMGLFVGELMKRTKGRANPQQAAALFKDAIEKGLEKDPEEE